MRYGSYVSLVVLLVMLILTNAAHADSGDGAKLYADNCAGCHGQTGKGDGPAAAALTPKPTDFSKVLSGKPDEWISKVITAGGQAVGKAPLMPGFDGAFNAEQLRDLIAYIKELAAKQ